jgi:Domain of unknown function (DUF4145)
VGDRTCKYVLHYPVGTPDDSVALQIPEAIAEDFKEALRCMFVSAYRATVTMCRRSVQAACVDLKAKGDNLYSQIDYLADNQQITQPLRQMAHAVRLEGNKGAHPDREKKPPEAQMNEQVTQAQPISDNLAGVSVDDAEAVIAFTREFFHHVYVMPARLKRYTPEASTEGS